MSTSTSIQQLVSEWIQTGAEPTAVGLMSAPVGLMSAPVGSNLEQATSSGLFLGNNTSDTTAAGRDIYSNPKNLPTAISSILNHAQTRADFHPASTPPDKLANHFKAYVTEIDKTPFFHLLEHRDAKQEFYSKNYNVLIDQIANLYDGVSNSDREKLKTAIKELARSVFSEVKSNRWENLFSQSTIDYSNPAEPHIFIYYTKLHFGHDATSSKSEVNQQTYTVSKTKYAILPNLIEAYADKLASLDKTSVDDWLSSSTSPADKNVKLCIDKQTA